MFLIESMIAILLFSIGVLGIVGVSAYSVAAQSDAEYRTAAAALASEIAQQAWLGVDRYTGLTQELRAESLATTLAAFQNQGSGEDCKFTGGDSTHPAVVAWLAKARALPGASDASMQQILVETGTAFNKVTVTVCWQVPSNPAPRKHVLVTYVN